MAPAPERNPPATSSVSIEADGDWFVATDDATGVASQGRTRPDALNNLAEALELHAGGGEDIEDPDAFLRDELDIDPDDPDGRDPPWL